MNDNSMEPEQAAADMDGEALPPQQSLHWPTAAEKFPQPGWDGAVKRSKYRLRMWVTRRLRTDFLACTAAHPVWSELYRRHPGCFYPLLTYLVDRRFGSAQRFEVTQASLDQAARLFGPELSMRLVRGERVPLWSLDADYRVELSLNDDVSWKEGHWAISLRNVQGQRVFHMSFTFLPGGALLLGSVQGPKTGTLDAETVIRDVTKIAQGLRPPHLVFEAVRAAAARWGATPVLGIDPDHHVMKRWNQSKQRFHFNYRQFWAEVGGERQADGYWHIAAQPAQRDAAEVPARKRAMYRRRYDMLGGLALAVAACLSPAVDNRVDNRIEEVLTSTERR